ncbi:hypothetical protein ES703_93020 [subsurface metagenome]
MENPISAGNKLMDAAFQHALEILLKFSAGNLDQYPQGHSCTHLDFIYVRANDLDLTVLYLPHRLSS